MPTRFLSLGVMLLGLWFLSGCGDSEDSTADTGADSTLNISDSSEPGTSEDPVADSSATGLPDTNLQNDTTTAGEVPAPKLAWKFNIRESNKGYEGNVALLINGKEYIVVPNAAVEYFELEKGGYGDWGVPAGAAMAMYGMGEGGGEVFYTEVGKGEVILHRKEIGETEQPFKVLKRFPVR